MKYEPTWPDVGRICADVDGESGLRTERKGVKQIKTREAESQGRGKREAETRDPRPNTGEERPETGEE
jgi:hypothetical protein